MKLDKILQYYNVHLHPQEEFHMKPCARECPISFYIKTHHGYNQIFTFIIFMLSGRQSVILPVISKRLLFPPISDSKLWPSPETHTYQHTSQFLSQLPRLHIYQPLWLSSPPFILHSINSFNFLLHGFPCLFWQFACLFGLVSLRNKVRKKVNCPKCQTNLFNLTSLPLSCAFESITCET